MVNNIRELLQAVYKPAVPRPDFKEKLIKRLKEATDKLKEGREIE